jgi:hypothetical protein
LRAGGSSSGAASGALEHVGEVEDERARLLFVALVLVDRLPQFAGRNPLTELVARAGEVLARSPAPGARVVPGEERARRDLRPELERDRIVGIGRLDGDRLLGLLVLLERRGLFLGFVD